MSYITLLVTKIIIITIHNAQSQSRPHCYCYYLLLRLRCVVYGVFASVINFAMSHCECEWLLATLPLARTIPCLCWCWSLVRSRSHSRLSSSFPLFICIKTERAGKPYFAIQHCMRIYGLWYDSIHQIYYPAYRQLRAALRTFNKNKNVFCFHIHFFSYN